MTLEVSLQDEGTVVLFIARGVNEGNCVFLCLLLERSNRILFLSQFVPVTGLKLRPFRWIVAEPLSQLRARGDVLQPQVHGGAFLGQAARPEPLDQNPRPVVRRGLVVGAFELDHRHITRVRPPPGQSGRAKTDGTTWVPFCAKPPPWAKLVPLPRKASPSAAMPRFGGRNEIRTSRYSASSCASRKPA